MANKSPIDKLDQAISKILTEYSDEISTNLDIVVQKVCSKGVKALREESAAKFDGKYYPRNWKSQIDRARLNTSGVIYNREYSMPHLLEYGHVIRSGGRNVGRVKGRAHIEPVAKKLVDDFEKELKKYL